MNEPKFYDFSGKIMFQQKQTCLTKLQCLFNPYHTVTLFVIFTTLLMKFDLFQAIAKVQVQVAATPVQRVMMEVNPNHTVKEMTKRAIDLPLTYNNVVIFISQILIYFIFIRKQLELFAKMRKQTESYIRVIFYKMYLIFTLTRINNVCFVLPNQSFSNYCYTCDCGN